MTEAKRRVAALVLATMVAAAGAFAVSVAVSADANAKECTGLDSEN